MHDHHNSEGDAGAAAVAPCSGPPPAAPSKRRAAGIVRRHEEEEEGHRGSDNHKGRGRGRGRVHGPTGSREDAGEREGEGEGEGCAMGSAAAAACWHPSDHGNVVGHQRESGEEDDDDEVQQQQEEEEEVDEAEAEADTGEYSSAVVVSTRVDGELEGTRVTVSLHDQDVLPRKQKQIQPIPWDTVPTDAQSSSLKRVLVANILCMLIGFSFCYLNIVIFFSTPAIVYVIMTNRKLAPDVRPIFYYGTFTLGALSAITSAIGFFSGFWRHPDVKESLKIWAEYILPITFCVFLSYTVLSTVTIVLMHRSTYHQKKMAELQIELDLQTLTRCYKIWGRCVVGVAQANTSLVSASDSPNIICLVNPDIEMRGDLVNKLGIDLHTLQSCFDPNELARIELKNNHTAFVIKLPQMYRSGETFVFKVATAGIFLCTNKLIVVLRDFFPLFEGSLFHNVDSLTDVVIRLLYRSIFSFEEHLSLINASSEKIEAELAKSIDNSQLFKLFTLEKSLVYYMSALSSTAHAINRLMDPQVRKKLKITQLQHALLEDVSIENAQCLNMARVYSQILSELMDSRASIVDKNLTIMTKNMNALGLAVGIPTFITAFMGMSEFTAMVGLALDKWWYLTYALGLITLIILSIGCFFVVRKGDRLWTL
ncbi:divalent metal ion transporter [Pelomyxa schiedti]|nr:divalent metal ion transporter [Pelomyxa schiedti]